MQIICLNEANSVPFIIKIFIWLNFFDRGNPKSRDIYCLLVKLKTKMATEIGPESFPAESFDENEPREGEPEDIGAIRNLSLKGL